MQHVYNSQDMEATYMSINRGMDKEYVVYTYIYYIYIYIYTHTHIHNGISLSYKKDEIMPFATTWMDLEITTLSKLSHTEKDKYHMIPLICGI